MRRSMLAIAVLMTWAVGACAAPLGADHSGSPLSTNSDSGRPPRPLPTS